MDSNVRLRRLADIKKQLGIQDDGVIRHLFRRPPPKSFSVPGELHILDPNPKCRFRPKEDPMSSVDHTPTSVAPSHPRGGPGRPSPKPRRQPPGKPVAPYRPKVPMMPPTRNGRVSPTPDTRYEPIELCEANDSTARKDDTRYEPIELCESTSSSAVHQKETNSASALAHQPRKNFSNLLLRTPLPSSLDTKQESSTESSAVDPMRDRPRLNTPPGSGGPNSPLHGNPTNCRERTSSSDTESYALATVVGVSLPAEQYSEVSQRGLKPPPAPLDPSQPPVTGQLNPDTEYNITTHVAMNRVIPPASRDEYSSLDHPSFPRRDMTPDLGYTEIDILPDTPPQHELPPAEDLGYTEIDIMPEPQPQVVVQQQACYSSLNSNVAREDVASHTAKDDSFGSSSKKAPPSPRHRPPCARPRPHLPPKPSHLRRSLDLSDTSRSASPASPSHSTMTAHVTPSHSTQNASTHLGPRYETTETFGGSVESQRTPPRPIARVHSPGHTTANSNRRNPAPSSSMQSHCEVDIDALIRRKAVKDKKEEAALVQPRYEGIDLNQVQESNSLAPTEDTLFHGWEEPPMPSDTKEQQEIVEVINSYSGTSPALRLEDMDPDFLLGEGEDGSSPAAHSSGGDSRPGSLARPRSTDSSEPDDDRRWEASRPRRKAPLPPHVRRNSPVPQMGMMLDHQPRQTLTLDRVPRGSGDHLNPGSEFMMKKSLSPVSPGLKARFGNFFKKKKDPSKSFPSVPFAMESKGRSSTLPHRQSGKSANPTILLPQENWDEDEKNDELETSLPDAYAYSVVTINDVRKASPSQVRRRPRKGKKGFELRKSRSVEHLSDHTKDEDAKKNGLSESPLVSESLDVESHIYAIVNKKNRAPPPPQRVPSPSSPKPSPRNIHAEGARAAAATRPPVPLRPAAKPTLQPSHADDNGTGSPEPAVAVVEQADRELDNDLANNDDVDGKGDRSMEDVGGVPEGVQVKQRPVYAIVVKSGEKMDASLKEENAGQEIGISVGGGDEEGASPPNSAPPIIKARKSTPPARPVPYASESKSASPQQPPPIHTTSSRSATKYAHLVRSAPPSHAAPRPPAPQIADLSQLKNMTPPSHPPPPVPPAGSRPPKPARSRSEDRGVVPPASDPIYEAVDEDDACESPGPLPILKQKYPALKPKQKPAPPPPNMKKARSLDSPTSKGGSLAQSPPHMVISQSPQHGMETFGQPHFLFSAGRVTSFIEVGQEIPVSPSMSSSTASSALEANDSDLSSEWDPSSGEEEEEEEEGEKSDSTPKSKVFYIVQEILQTEKTFVRGLALLHKDFRGHMMSANRAHEKQVISEEMLRVILSNIGSLYTFNTGLLAELEGRIANWESNPRIGDIFVKNAPFLKLYSEYIGNFDHALKTLDELQKKNSLFAQVLRDFESEPQCNNLPVAGYLLETVQRIPRYKLLLADYMKHLPEDSDDRPNSEKALGMISSVASHINDTIRQMDNFKKTVEVSKKLIGDVGDSLISPHRRLLKEGELLKSSRKEKQPRMFFLFTDLLIYASAIPPANTTYRVIKRIPLSGMKVDHLDDPEMKYGFQIISTCKSFRLDASNAEERNQWMQSFETAIKDHAQRMLSREKNRKSLMMPTTGSDAPPLGHYAPPWLPDSSVSMCQLCSIHFTVTRRRHHCRACGMIFCGECSEYMAPLAYKASKMCRVCQTCYEQLEGPVVGVEAIDGGSLKNVHRRARPLRASKKNVSMPSVLSEVKARDQNAVISDYLYCRLTNKSKQFKRKWFIVYNLVLYEFKRHEDVSAQRSITLPSYQVVSPVPGQDALVFCLEHPGAGKFFFKASDDEQLERWVEVLRKAVRGEE